MGSASALLQDIPGERSWAAPCSHGHRRKHSFVRPFFSKYSTAVLFVSLSFALTFSLQPVFPYPFLFFFFGAIVASAWFCGTGPGLFSVLVSTLVADYYFLPPFNSFSVTPTVEAYFAAFVLCALFASWVSSSKKETEQALLQARDELEQRVCERTATLMRTQGELAHLSRMLSMAEVTASIVHEIGQPLTGVVTNSQACLEWLASVPPNTEKARRSAESIVRDGTRAGAVLNRVRALFHKGRPEKEWLNINDLIHELVVLVTDEAKRRQIRIHTHFGYDLPKVKVDRVQLQQVVLNLLLNAMDAMNETPAEDRKVFLSSRKSGTDIAVRVEDCGIGLKPNVCEQVFEPFFSTKPHGIGVGLSISRSIVEAHNGRIEACSRPEGGARLQFTIPIAAGAVDE
jgi:C4-dicarboxylate-specific signal transduction histidine kinase